MGKITLQEIADIAHVSKSTVSRALNNSGYVSEEVRSKILKIAEENAYNGLKLRNFQQSTKPGVIGVVFPTLTSEFFGSIAEGITSVADEKEYGVMLFATNDDPRKELHSLDILKELNVSGVIITPVAAYDAMAGWNRLQNKLDALNIPVVLVDRNVKRSNWDSIYYDNYNGAYLIGETLVKEGHERIGAMIGDLCLQLGVDRLNGFNHALEMGRKSISTDFFLQSENVISIEKAYRYTAQAIQENRLPDAVFVSNSLIATGFLKAIFAYGLVPGKDVRCIGFDYLDALNVLDFEYSYLERETFETGRMAMQMLLDRFEHNIASRREYVTPAKLVR